MRKRGSVYPPYDVRDPPGATIYRLRQNYGWSQRELGDKCHKPLDHTTIRRLELNKGYTQDSLERVAKALGVRSVNDLFMPPELSDWASLPKHVQRRLAKSVQNAAHSYSSKKNRTTV